MKWNELRGRRMFAFAIEMIVGFIWTRSHSWNWLLFDHEISKTNNTHMLNIEHRHIHWRFAITVSAVSSIDQCCNVKHVNIVNRARIATQYHITIYNYYHRWSRMKQRAKWRKRAKLKNSQLRTAYCTKYEAWSLSMLLQFCETVCAYTICR